MAAKRMRRKSYRRKNTLKRRNNSFKRRKNTLERRKNTFKRRKTMGARKYTKRYNKNKRSTGGMPGGMPGFRSALPSDDSGIEMTDFVLEEISRKRAATERRLLGEQLFETGMHHYDEGMKLSGKFNYRQAVIEFDNALRDISALSERRGQSELIKTKLDETIKQIETNRDAATNLRFQADIKADRTSNYQDV